MDEPPSRSLQRCGLWAYYLALWTPTSYEERFRQKNSTSPPTGTLGVSRTSRLAQDSELICALNRTSRSGFSPRQTSQQESGQCCRARLVLSREQIQVSTNSMQHPTVHRKMALNLRLGKLPLGWSCPTKFQVTFLFSDSAWNVPNWHPVYPQSEIWKTPCLFSTSCCFRHSDLSMVTEVLSDNRIFADTIPSLYNFHALILYRWSSSRLSIFYLELFPYRDLCWPITLRRLPLLLTSSVFNDSVPFSLFHDPQNDLY